MIHNAQRALFDFFPGRSIEIQEVDEQVSSDGGLIVFRQLDQKLGLTRGFVGQVQDGRSVPRHSLLSVIRQRIFGIIAGYEDQNDHDNLRSDPIFKLIADRTADGRDLASQPTISRVENSVTAGDLLRLEDWFIGSFVESFDHEPDHITLDVDATIDFFGIQWEVPSPTTARQWLLRIALYQLLRTQEIAGDWIWIVDHTG